MSEQRDWKCRGCGKTGTEGTGPGRPRQWCDNNCRRRSSYRGTCATCGGPTGYSGTSVPPKRCQDCFTLASADEGRERMADTWAARREEFAALYREGLTLREIAERIGTTPGTAAGMVHRLRSYGYDLPFRYAMRGGRRVAA